MTDLLHERKRYSEGKMQQFREALERHECVQRNPELAIYATGSFARREASQHSDMDLFIVDVTASGTVSNLELILVKAKLIELCRQLRLPDFSGDGRFLKCHKQTDMSKFLGGPEDDYENSFTARLLLLLESAPICNDKAYNKLLEDMVALYYRDYHDHEKTFRPIFLVNDILRYWKTLCLNYENKRNRPQENIDAKLGNHIKNLKLKYSRLITCFSSVIVLATHSEVLDPQTLVEHMRASPLERLAKASTSIVDGSAIMSKLREEYTWFLQHTGKEERLVKEWLSDERVRNDAFDRSRKFGQLVFDLLLRATGNSGSLRYIVI